MIKIYNILIIISMTMIPILGASSDMLAGQLRCEYLVNPLGVDVAKPRMSWKIEAGSQNTESTVRSLK